MLRTTLFWRGIHLLRWAHRKRRNKNIGRKVRKTKIPNSISIDTRPRSFESRRRYGHWEGDSLISRKSKAALNTLAERKSRLVLITKLPRKGAAETNKAIIPRLKKPRHEGVRPLRWTTEPRTPIMSSFWLSSALNATLLAPIHRGSEAPRRNWIASFGGTCQRGPTSVRLLPSKLLGSRKNHLDEILIHTNVY